MYADKITDIRLNSLITQLYVSKIILCLKLFNYMIELELYN